MYNAEFLMLEDLTDVYGPPEFMRHRVAEPQEGMEALAVLDRRRKEVALEALVVTLDFFTKVILQFRQELLNLKQIGMIHNSEGMIEGLSV